MSRTYYLLIILFLHSVVQNQRNFVNIATINIVVAKELFQDDLCELGHEPENLFKMVVWVSTNILLKNLSKIKLDNKLEYQGISYFFVITVVFRNLSMTLSKSTRLCYGLGHLFNDLTASMWFTYLMVYLQFVLCFDANVAGFVLLVGQVADAIATPLLGYEADNTTHLWLCKKFGRRKLLHLIGTVCVTLSFPFIFIQCPGCGNASQWSMVVYLTPLVVVFQIGWAAVQVSHLALIPIITKNSSERDLLNVLRNAFDAVADVTVFVVTWIVFTASVSGPSDYLSIAKDDKYKFMIIVLVLTLIGSLFSAIFHLGVQEVEGSSDVSIQPSESCPITLNWRQWLKEVQFYQMALLYTLARLFQNFCSVFIPLYLQESLKATQDFMAKIPLLIHVSGFASSIAARYLIKCFGKGLASFTGAVVGIGGCIWMYFGEGPSFCTQYIYVVATLLGTGSNILVVSTLAWIPDLIGTSTDSGTFVYGAMSFFDKLANGIGILIIQYLHKIMCKECNWFYRHVMSYGVGTIGVIFVIVLVTVMKVKFGDQGRQIKGKKMYEKYDGDGDSGVAIHESDERKPLLK